MRRKKGVEDIDFMPWAVCEREFIRVVERDLPMVQSILNMAKLRSSFIKSMTVSDTNVSFVVENYYEVCKELLVALLLTKGLKAKNHQCLITYFYRTCPQYEPEAHLLLQMSYLRNRLAYYGESIELSFYDKYKENFQRIIQILEKLVEENVPMAP